MSNLVDCAVAELRSGILRKIENKKSSFIGFHSYPTADAWEHNQYAHLHGVLFYTLHGIINCAVAEGVRIVPPKCAVWIPPGLPHAASGSSGVECCLIFVPPKIAQQLPSQSTTYCVLPLLHELLLKASNLSSGCETNERESRLISVLIDEIEVAPVEPMLLPMPRDARLRKLGNLILEAPQDKANIEQWAARIGMSARSMTRRIVSEVGMNFSTWRRYLHVYLAIQRIGDGDRVKTVALDLGYDSASTFTTMFRKMTGKSPTQYLSDRNHSC